MDAINANFLRKGTKRSGIALKQRTEKAADNSACPSILGPTNTGNNGWWTVQPQSELSGKPESIKDFITEALATAPSTRFLQARRFAKVRIAHTHDFGMVGRATISARIFPSMLHCQ
jgi:hypothetical protein